MCQIEDRFLVAITRAYEAYIEHGPRSNEKLKILHGWIKTELTDILDNEYTIVSLSNDVADSREETVTGKYYDKNVDICVSRDNMDIGIISVKFINSSFIKNANNYIEGQLGETANLRSNSIIFAHLFCITEPIPKYKKVGDNMICNERESIRNYDIEKYHRLVNECPKPPHAPDVQGICIAKSDVIIGQNRDATAISGLATRQDLNQLNAANLDIIFNEMNISSFFTNFVLKVDAKYLELQQANQQNQP